MLCSKQCPHPVEQSLTCIVFWRHELLTLSRIMSPANSRRWTNAGLKLGQRLRLVFAGIIMYTRVLSQQTRRWPNAGLMLTQRRRRWDNISPASGRRLVFDGITSSELLLYTWAKNTRCLHNVLFCFLSVNCMFICNTILHVIYLHSRLIKLLNHRHFQIWEHAEIPYNNTYKLSRRVPSKNMLTHVLPFWEKAD